MITPGLHAWGTGVGFIPPPAIVSWSGASFEASVCSGFDPVPRPEAVELALGKLRPRVRSLVLDNVNEDGPRVAPDRFTSIPENAGRPHRHTHIRPPGDVIRLKDRWSYVLQPSLECTISRGFLEFPFRPFPYQLEGIAFLYPRYAALLADEMGLGKTMQAITAMRLLLHSGALAKVLIICPKPLVTNWCRELQLWAPELPCAVIAGDRERRAWQWGHPDAVISIANYELAQRDHEIFRDGKVSFDLVVLDESQRIKNPRSTTSEAVRSIRRRRSWALTGTPVENSTQDLFGVFEFLSAGYLRPEMSPRHMSQAAADYMLRRTKDSVLQDLPAKLIRDANVELTPEQRRRYDIAEREGVLHLNELGKSVTIQHVFELILRLKQICNFDPMTGASAKLEQLEADLDEIVASGKKAIVFSQWVSTLATLAERLARLQPLQFHGRIPHKQRERVIRTFRELPDRHLLLMSYGAGSVGLNLQFCQYVFLFDRWWNPAVEDQAINRAHRIGAAGPVTITRFLALDTIEERIDHVLQAKRELSELIFSNLDTSRVAMTQEDFFRLFHLSGPIETPLRAAA